MSEGLGVVSDKHLAAVNAPKLIIMQRTLTQTYDTCVHSMYSVKPADFFDRIPLPVGNSCIVSMGVSSLKRLKTMESALHKVTSKFSSVSPESNAIAGFPCFRVSG